MGCAVSILPTQYAGHAIELAAEACKTNCSHVVAVGGDGTAHEVLNGIMTVPTRNRPNFGVLPFGSANDFVRSAGLTGGLAQLETLLKQGSTAQVDVGQVYFHDAEGNEQMRYFLNIADLGLGASVMQKIARLPRFVPASIAYHGSIVATLFDYRNIPLAYQTAETQWSGKAKMLAVANAQCFGNGTWIAPHAHINSGKLALVCIGDVSLGDYVRHLPSLQKARKISDSRVEYLHAHRVTVEAESGKLPLEADGEFLGFAPATFEIIPGAVSLICDPAQAALCG